MAWLLYLISLIPLFIYLSIKYYNSCVFYLLKDGKFGELTFGQHAFIISVLSFVVGIIIIFVLKHKSRSGFDLHGARVTSSPQNINHELIGVLSSVVLPFISVNFESGCESLASIFMLFIIGLITTRSSIYYKNPVLAILNFKIYQIDIEHQNFDSNKTVNIISIYSLKENDSLYLKEIGENVYYAKKTDDGKKQFS